MSNNNSCPPKRTRLERSCKKSYQNVEPEASPKVKKAKLSLDTTDPDIAGPVSVRVTRSASKKRIALVTEPAPKLHKKRKDGPNVSGQSRSKAKKVVVRASSSKAKSEPARPKPGGRKSKRSVATAATDSSNSTANQNSHQSHTTNINALSDKEMLTILSYLNIHQQVQVELVCKRWHWIVSLLCSDRTELQLIQRPVVYNLLADITRYQFFTDYHSNLRLEILCYHVTKPITKQAVQWFARRFPNVTQLTLFGVDHLSVERFAELLSNYQDQLSTLEIFSSVAQCQAYMCDTFWNALDALPALRRLYLPFDYGLDRHPVLSRLYYRLKFIYHRSKGERQTADMEERATRHQPEGAAEVQAVGQMMQCCMMDRDGQLGQFMLRFDRAAEGEEPRKISVSGLGLYCGHVEFAEFSEHLNRSKLEAMIGSQSVQLHAHESGPREIRHIDLELPCNVRLSRFLPILATQQHLTTIRITARRPPNDPNTDSRLFADVTEANYRQVLRVQLDRVQHLTLAHFEVRDDLLLGKIVPHIFPNLVTINFEDCLFSVHQCQTYLDAFMLGLPTLTEVRHNYQTAFRIERSAPGDDPDLVAERNIRMRHHVVRLYQNRVGFTWLHQNNQIQNTADLEFLNRFMDLLRAHPMLRGRERELMLRAVEAREEEQERAIDEGRGDAEVREVQVEDEEEQQRQ